MPSCPSQPRPRAVRILWQLGTVQRPRNGHLQADLLEYGTVVDSVVPHQDQSELVQCEAKPVKRVTQVGDPKAKPTCGLNLRLNEYQIELIRSMAEREERSMQQIVKRVLIPALEAALTDAA